MACTMARQRARLRILAALGAALVRVHGPNAETHAIWKEVLASAIASGDRPHADVGSRLISATAL